VRRSLLIYDRSLLICKRSLLISIAHSCYAYLRYAAGKEPHPLGARRKKLLDFLEQVTHTHTHTRARTDTDTYTYTQTYVHAYMHTHVEILT
jgi:hypothetical protein